MSSTTQTQPHGAAAAPPPQRSGIAALKALWARPELAILPVLLVVIIVGSTLNRSFVSYDNIYGILQQASELAVLVMGLTLVLITGKFDLSLESTFGLAPMSC